MNCVTFEFEKGHINDADDELLIEINGRTAGWELYESNKLMGGRLQIIFNQGKKLAVVVFVGRAGEEYTGPGKGGHVAWTVADSPEDAFERIVSGNKAAPD